MAVPCSWEERDGGPALGCGAHDEVSEFWVDNDSLDFGIAVGGEVPGTVFRGRDTLTGVTVTEGDKNIFGSFPEILVDKSGLFAA